MSNKPTALSPTNQPTNQPTTMLTANLWNTAVKLEGLDAGHIEDHEIDMVHRAMSLLAEEGIAIRNALEEHIEHGDQHSGMRLRNVLMSHLSHLFPQEEGTSMEVYSAHLLKQVE